MVITKYQDYFKIISTYHKAGPGQRQTYLNGYVRACLLTLPDNFTRQQLQLFYVRENQKYVTSNSTA